MSRKNDDAKPASARKLTVKRNTLRDLSVSNGSAKDVRGGRTSGTGVVYGDSVKCLQMSC